MNKTSPSRPKAELHAKRGCRNNSNDRRERQTLPIPNHLVSLSPYPPLLLARTEPRPPLCHLNQLPAPTPQRMRRKKIHTNICQVFISYSAWGFILLQQYRPPRGGRTSLVPPFYPRKCVRRTMFLNTRVAPWSEADNNLRNK